MSQGQPNLVPPRVRYLIPRSIPLDDFYRRTAAVFEQRQFSNAGPFVRQLGREIAALHHVRYCIPTASGTAALQLVARGLGLTGEVVTPAFTFVGTAHALKWIGIEPVFADIDPVTLTIDPASVQRCITDVTSAVLGVHIFGQPCDVNALDRLGAAHDVKLFYDAAHCFGDRGSGMSVGGGGRAEVLSFHATKVFHTFEGGAILTNDEAFARELESMKSFGFEGQDRVCRLGTNAKMNEISAAYGLSMLPHLPQTLNRLRSIQARYRRNLAGAHGFRLFEVSGNTSYVPLLVDPADHGVTRDALWKALLNQGIETRRYFTPSLNHCEPYRSCERSRSLDCSTAESVASRILCLPCYFDLENDQVDMVSDAVLHIFATAVTA